MKNGRVALFFALFLAYAFAQQPPTPPAIAAVQRALSDFCTQLMALLPILAMVLVVMAAFAYAAGQSMGADTRARANVWAGSMLTAAAIGIVIVLLVPPLLSTIYGSAVSCNP